MRPATDISVGTIVRGQLDSSRGNDPKIASS
jgi:hypothetical protein